MGFVKNGLDCKKFGLLFFRTGPNLSVSICFLDSKSFCLTLSKQCCGVFFCVLFNKKKVHYFIYNTRILSLKLHAQGSISLKL